MKGPHVLMTRVGGSRSGIVLAEKNRKDHQLVLIIRNEEGGKRKSVLGGVGGRGGPLRGKIILNRRKSATKKSKLTTPMGDRGDLRRKWCN